MTLDYEIPDKKNWVENEMLIVEAIQAIVTSSEIPPEKMPIVDIDDGHCSIRFRNDSSTFCEFNIRTEDKKDKFVRVRVLEKRGKRPQIRMMRLKCDYDDIDDIVKSLNRIASKVQAAAEKCVS